MGRVKSGAAAVFDRLKGGSGVVGDAEPIE